MLLMSSANVEHSVKGWLTSRVIKSGLDTFRVYNSARAAFRTAGFSLSRKFWACAATKHESQTKSRYIDSKQERRIKKNHSFLRMSELWSRVTYQASEKFPKRLKLRRQQGSWQVRTGFSFETCNSSGQTQFKVICAKRGIQRAEHYLLLFVLLITIKKNIRDL